MAGYKLNDMQQLDDDIRHRHKTYNANNPNNTKPRNRKVYFANCNQSTNQSINQSINQSVFVY